MNILEQIHEHCIFKRRIQRLAFWLSSVIPMGARVLDVGAGDGTLDAVLLQRRPDIRIQGLDVAVRPVTAVPVEKFDGRELPFADQSWDVVMFVDVLHHTTCASDLLAEAGRVGKVVIIKDHLNQGLLSDQTLRWMDHVGNARHGVVLPYDYWPLSRWHSTFRLLQMSPISWRDKLSLYPFPLTLWCDRSLHFIALLEPCQGSSRMSPRERRSSVTPQTVLQT